MIYKFHHKEIGPVEVRRSKRSKRMRMSMKPFHPLLISVPYHTDADSLKAFITQNKDWIIKTKNKIKTKEKEQSLFSPETKFRTKYRELKLLPILKKKGFQAELKNKTLIIRYDEQADITTANFQNAVRSVIVETLRREAKDYLPQRVYKLALQYDLDVGRVSVRNAKTRWGSCSSQNNISLNIHLMRLPDELIEYVILHELVHTKHKNHSRQFWEYLEQISPGAKEKDRSLKQFSPVIW